MSLVDAYKRQFELRDWPSVLARLPSLAGQTVLDFGCGVGDLAAALVSRGAKVIGIEMNEELLAAARSRNLANAEFLVGDLRALPDLGELADGIWCSFTAAYFVDLPEVLIQWARRLRVGGWIAITEIDDLFGHEPLGERSKALLDAYVRDAHDAGRYDFRMGHKLERHLEAAGFRVSEAVTVEDRELSFTGPASAEVIQAWRGRFDRMSLLRATWGEEFELVRDDFLRALGDPDHRSLAKVWYCAAVKPTSAQLIAR